MRPTSPPVSFGREAQYARQHRSTASSLNPHACVCVGFRDHIVQRMEFDDHEDHEKNWNDTDDCAC
jgi:hypothetical protein